MSEGEGLTIIAISAFTSALHDAQSQESPHGVDAAYYRTAGATLNVSNSGVMVAVPNSPCTIADTCCEHLAPAFRILFTLPALNI